MQYLNFEKVNILTVDSDRNSRDGIKMILLNIGFRELRFSANLKDALPIIEELTPDLLICASEIPESNFPSFVSRIRHHQIGTNPFLPIIATIRKPTPEIVIKIIESGADDLIAIPLSSSQLLDRIRTLVKFRKQFIVTNDYIGPERGKVKKSDNDIPKIDVPNVLKAKITGDKAELAFIQAAIDETIGKVNIQKLEAHAGAIDDLVVQIAPALEMGGPLGNVMKQLMARLLYMAEDTARRLGGTKYGHVSELCQSLIKVSNAIIDAKGAPNDKDVKLLAPLSQAIQAGFGKSDTRIAAHKISDTIKEK